MTNNHIDYIEFPAPDLEATKTFYHSCFGWVFTDYGPEYTAFEESGVSGGFRLSKEPVADGVLVVLYHNNLEIVQNKIRAAGGEITVPTFSFPGGQRFHFRDPAGNMLAVWSEDPAAI
ncbi:VOC family protein [Robiginitalea sp. M366]|uniref:VOC family protein n=1 Tax=Robiginitalea aestuariiviva TaxID=3036903 RepID=UPI00240E1015|nr:VOC family protein [Robiginitalea aestuariiviva]MDG1570889.1 VOC family protein [Robiginitalea aestuariiviva]